VVRETEKNDLCFLEPGRPVAILIDGGFFHARYRKVFLKNGEKHDAATAAKNMYTMVLRHVEGHTLYRIFYYDCPPLLKKVHHPITKKCIDFAKTEMAQFRMEFLNHLSRMRKIALRLGRLSDMDEWLIRPSATRELLKGNLKIEDLAEKDVYFEAKQKGVDMRIGLDIASLAYKKQVGRIILVAGDSDFVPAAKLARREGIDFILDPMWKSIPEELHIHVDGVRSTWDRKESPASSKKNPPKKRAA
jgi:uncharacterized LabA/DUF88 family protein